MKFSPTRTDPSIAILSPDIPDIERTGPVPGPSATNLWEFHFIHYAATTKNGCLLSSFLLFVGVYYFISIKILPWTGKSYPHREKTTPFPTRPIFLTPDRTDPRFKQNIAPWLESGLHGPVRESPTVRDAPLVFSPIILVPFSTKKIIRHGLFSKLNQTCSR